MEKWAGRFMDCVEVSASTTYGNPDDAAKEIIAPFGGKLLAAGAGSRARPAARPRWARLVSRPGVAAAPSRPRARA